MKTFVTLVMLPIFLSLVLWVSMALPGQSGVVDCSTPDCGYHQNLSVGGSMKTPSVTGYCQSSKQFVQLKLKSHDDYRKPHYCPGTKELMQPIYSGSDVAKIPCPKCGNKTLKYTLLFFKD